MRVWRHMLLRRLLALADALAVVVGAVLFAAFFGGTASRAIWMIGLIPVWIAAAKICGLYDRDQRGLRHLTVDELPEILAWGLSSTVAVSLALRAAPSGYQLGILPAAELGGTIIGAAFVLRGSARFLWRSTTPPERTLIVGSGPIAAATRRKLDLFRDIHVQVVHGYQDLVLESILDDREWLPHVDRIILASQSIDELLIRELIELCRKERIRLSVVPPLRGLFGTAVQLNHIADLPVIEYNTWDVSRSTLLGKRVVDVTLSVVALVVTAPVFAAAAVAIKLDSRGSVFFKQMRAGEHGKPFSMLKFRTMIDDAERHLPNLVSFDALEDPMFKLPADPRVTRVGRILRRTSLDELPQLVNVLLGEMSVVGPRPEQIELVRRYRPEHLFRLSVKPGMTGPMQVYGRGRLRFDERLAIEREYIENLSLRRDMRILAMTLPAVISGHGAY